MCRDVDVGHMGLDVSFSKPGGLDGIVQNVTFFLAHERHENTPGNKIWLRLVDECELYVSDGLTSI